MYKKLQDVRSRRLGARGDRLAAVKWMDLSVQSMGGKEASVGWESKKGWSGGMEGSVQRMQGREAHRDRA